MEAGNISSLRELQLQMPRILEEYGNDQSLTLLAFTNPLFALEKIGYSFTSEAREEIIQHIRFGKEGIDKLNKLKADIFTITGQSFNLDDSIIVRERLAKVLSIDETAPKSKSKAAVVRPTDAIFDAVVKPVVVKDGTVEDPLEAYVSEHPVIAPLLEYRKIQVLAPQLASAEVSEKILSQKEKLPFKQLTFRLSRK